MKYITPELEIMQLQTADIITVSDPDYVPEGEDSITALPDEW